jgi:hypothetical protein
MNNKLNQIFKSISDLEPPMNLENSIFRLIEREKERKIKTNLLLSYLGVASSFSLAFWAIFVFGNSFLQSEFWSMLSLIFSDVMLVAQNLKEYAYSLMETFPVVNVIAVLTPAFICLLFFNLLLSFKDKYKYNHNHFKFV